MHQEDLVTMLQAEGVPSRRARAYNDLVLLVSFAAKQGTQHPKYMDLVYMQIKVGQFALD